MPVIPGEQGKQYLELLEVLNTTLNVELLFLLNLR